MTHMGSVSAFQSVRCASSEGWQRSSGEAVVPVVMRRVYFALVRFRHVCGIWLSSGINNRWLGLWKVYCRPKKTLGNVRSRKTSGAFGQDYPKNNFDRVRKWLEMLGIRWDTNFCLLSDSCVFDPLWGADIRRSQFCKEKKINFISYKLTILKSGERVGGTKLLSGESGFFSMVSSRCRT